MWATSYTSRSIGRGICLNAQRATVATHQAPAEAGNAILAAPTRLPLTAPALHPPALMRERPGSSGHDCPAASAPVRSKHSNPLPPPPPPRPPRRISLAPPPFAHRAHAGENATVQLSTRPTKADPLGTPSLQEVIFKLRYEGSCHFQAKPHLQLRLCHALVDRHVWPQTPRAC
jgi:hypothetical protein